MNAEASRRQSNASLSKGSDIETAYSGSQDAEHDQLPSVDDIRLDSPRSRPSRCKFFLLAAFLVVAVVAATVAVVVTQADTGEDDFSMAKGESFQNPTTTFSPPTATSPPQEETAPQQTDMTAPVNRFEAVTKLLSDRGVSTKQAMSLEGSPQKRAVEWIANVDELTVSLDQIDSLVQRYIITVFFYAMGGEFWTNRLNFLSREDVCKWYIAGFAGDSKAPRQFGINCNAEGTVSKIHFPSNFLMGEFPMELSKLTDLETLDVFNNGKLTGGFPEFLIGLPKISFIALHYCGLQGQLPTWLGDLKSLKSLVLSNNEFTGSLPSSLSQLTNLEDLYLDDNSLSGSIAPLRGLSKLQNVVIEDNQFEGSLDDGIVGSWPQLRVFDASHNMLQSTIPTGMFNLANLRILDLHSNKFFGALPMPTGSQNSLEMLTLNENELTGAIPVEISQFANLHTLDLSGNSFISSIPAALGNLAKLEFLFLAQNNFDSGPIPESLASLVSLKQLSLKDTMRTGTIPDWIGNLKELILLDLDMNELGGNIPEALGNCMRMEYLLLNRNQLEGGIPATMSSMLNLKFFMIDQNKLSGSAEAVCKFPQNVEMFIADCQGETAEVDCPCCNVCCSAGNQQCNDDVWLGDSNPIWELGFERPGVELDASASRSYTVQFTGDIP